ncbi:MAG: glutamine-hydrolyzing carbamoyl-phosphate synthase small subunit [Thiotrichales bacterium]|nr:glutamine-hydrolyzing carbamoyl-phosphate synthase small subunit [Thiotrichales bacterium]
MTDKALLALEDGSLFHGQSIGSQGQTTGEVVFNTAITGYQEILTDPSYFKQIVTLTQPHIGNVGSNPDDEESAQIYASGLVIRDLPLLASNWRSRQPLSGYLQKHNVVAIADIDTRRLTRLLREKGAMKGCLVAGNSIDAQVAIKQAQDFSGLVGADLAQEVSTKDAYVCKEGRWQLGEGFEQLAQADQAFRVIAYDYGIKRNILRLLVSAGCAVTVVPARTPASEVLQEKPDGVFLSNGPGDPFPCDYAIDAIRELLAARTPVFGICLGHQLLSLAMGASTIKMKFGHHGANHPVQDLDTGQVMITSQNHGFAVDEASLPDDLKATHRSLFDGSLQGVHHTTQPAFGFQGHPEASPGPHDVQPLFKHFTDLMSQGN